MVKKVIIILCFVIIVLVGVFTAKYYFNKKNEANENKIVENTIVNNQNSNNTNVNNTTENVNEIKTNDTSKNEIETSKSENKTKNNTSSFVGKEEIAEKNTENKQEIAIDLVKKEWGEDNSVYFTVDSQNGNIFNISVRSKATTAALVEYEVDVNNKKVNVK